MKLVIIRSNLKEGLAAVERASGEHANLPILRHVLVEGAHNEITLTATNLEIAVTTTVSGKVIEDGKVTAPLGSFLSLVSAIPSERLNIEAKEKHIEVKTDNYHAVVHGASADEFPIIPKAKNTSHSIEYGGDLFKAALGQVVLATQASDMRPELTSVLFHFSLDALKLVATDSFRLAEKTIPKTQLTLHDADAFRVLVPLKTAMELLRIVKDNESIRIYYDENQVLFSSDTLELISRVVEGNFPDYQAIIPKEFSAECVIDREELSHALKLAGIFSTKSNEVRIRAAESKKALEVFSGDQALGENTYLLPAKIRGSVKELGFNYRYLLDGLKGLKGKEIFWGLGEESKPALLKDIQDGSYFYILMPILKA